MQNAKSYSTWNYKWWLFSSIQFSAMFKWFTRHMCYHFLMSLKSYKQKNYTAPLQEYIKTNSVLTTIFKKENHMGRHWLEKPARTGRFLNVAKKNKQLGWKENALRDLENLWNRKSFMNKQDYATIFTENTQRPFLLN